MIFHPRVESLQIFVNFNRLCQTGQTHHPVDDAHGHAEALSQLTALGLKIVRE